MTSLAVSPSPNVAGATAVGFKDWALVCAALGHGRQSVILRKGGIAEGRDGFRFKHENFFLFPTQYHQQSEMVRRGTDPSAARARRPGRHGGSRYFFALDFAAWIDDWTTLARLEPFHIWREEVVRARFAYDDQAGLQCAFGRVYRLDAPWSFPDRPAYGGCRSWVNLPTPPVDPGSTPVISDEAHAGRAAEVRALLNLR